jgi:lysophospholipase L1-like esterase/curved DNA-binding protein CbpA
MDDIEAALKVLGLAISATDDEINHAYRDLAMVWHPDRFPTDSRIRRKAEEKFKTINKAYELIKRSHYHRMASGHGPNQSQPADTADPVEPNKTRSNSPDGHDRPRGIRRFRLPMQQSIFFVAALVVVFPTAYVLYQSSSAHQFTSNSNGNTSTSHAAVLPATNTAPAPSDIHKSVTFAAAETSAPPAPIAKKPAAKPASNLGEIFKQHYKNRMKDFREQNKDLKTTKNIIFLGDSITEGFDLAKYFPKHNVLNRGISADVIGNALPKDDNRGVTKRLDESIFKCSPSEVFVLIGINDLGTGHKPETIEAGYREILQAIKSHSPDLKVHVQSLLPTRGSHAKHNASVLDVNARLQKLAKEFGYDFIDLHAKMTDDKNELKKEFTADGLHLKADGYKVWQEEINRKMGW